MSDEPIITPIGAPHSGDKPAAPIKRSFARDMNWLICILASLTALGAFGMAAYFFYGFTQTDTGFWTLASAFGLCFGVGSLVYGPMVIVAIIARRAANNRASRKAFALALLLLLPWVCVALVFIGWSALPKVYGFLALFLSLSFCYWAFFRLIRQPRG